MKAQFQSSTWIHRLSLIIVFLINVAPNEQGVNDTSERGRTVFMELFFPLPRNVGFSGCLD